jgi:hypothetical protein
MKAAVVVLCLLVGVVCSLPAEGQSRLNAGEQVGSSTSVSGSAKNSQRLAVTVTDENGVAVGSAVVRLQAFGCRRITR